LANFRRRQSPPFFADYQRYRPFLQLDFRRQCCYCGKREQLEFAGSFEIDHFKPKRKFPLLTCNYPNLYYACMFCNRSKSDAWPSEMEILAGERFWDPCTDTSTDHFACTFSDGHIQPLTPCGRYTIAKIRLNRPMIKTFRLRKIQLIQKLREVIRSERQVRQNIEATENETERELKRQILLLIVERTGYLKDTLREL
jgi:HNH endonuclease